MRVVNSISYYVPVDLLTRFSHPVGSCSSSLILEFEKRSVFRYVLATPGLRPATKNATQRCGENPWENGGKITSVSPLIFYGNVHYLNIRTRGENNKQRGRKGQQNRNHELKGGRKLLTPHVLQCRQPRRAPTQS